jgi:hypothetical protein
VGPTEEKSDGSQGFGNFDEPKKEDSGSEKQDDFGSFGEGPEADQKSKSDEGFGNFDEPNAKSNQSEGGFGDFNSEEDVDGFGNFDE